MNKWYAPWKAAGEHWHMAPLIKELHDAILARYPHAVLGTIGDQSHLTANPPEDHTPYSQTGYPAPAPYGSVDAIDIQGIPNLDAFAMRLVNLSRAGTIKWIHYLNWNGHQWTCLDGFQAIHASSDSPGHIHISIRTDHLTSAIGVALFPVVSSHHTVEPGDTLTSIAAAAKVSEPALYAANATVLNEVAVKHGRKSSNNGQYIYPGTVLTIP